MEFYVSVVSRHGRVVITDDSGIEIARMAAREWLNDGSLVSVSVSDAAVAAWDRSAAEGRE